MQALAEQIWTSTREQLQAILSPELYNLWFAPLRVVGMEKEWITVAVGDEFSEVWIRNNYLDIVQEVLFRVSGQPLKMKFQVPPDQPGGVMSAHKAGDSEKPVHSKPVMKDTTNEMMTASGDLVLNPKYTFDTFVVGNNNHFAHAAAVAVAQSPGKSYNPLFVYGGVGLGKTHLLHAIGQHVVNHKKGARVAYLSSEKFTNEYIDAIQNNQLMRFRKKYRQTDLLLIDDIHFLAGKERIQEEFFHTLNALHENRKQIVMTSDRPVGEIQNLEQRLVSRFEWGLVTDLQAPDVETRVAILRKKAAGVNPPIPEEIILFIANRIRANVRRLEGALTRVASYGTLTGKPLTVGMVEDLLREVFQEEGRSTLSIEAIQKKVAEYYDIRLADMTSKRRPENIAFPRQIAMYLSRELTASSLNVIGEAFGGRDHGTVLHACRLVKDRMDVDTNIRQVVSYLEKQLMR